MYKRRIRGWSQHIDFMFLDNLCVFFSLLIGFLLVKKEGILNSLFFWSILLEVVLINLVVIIVLDTYHSVLHHTPWDELVRLLRQTGCVVLVLVVFRLLAPGSDPDLLIIAVPVYQVWKNMSSSKFHKKTPLFAKNNGVSVREQKKNCYWAAAFSLAHSSAFSE